MTSQFTKKSLLKPWQTRTHCCGHIFADEFFGERKRSGHKMNAVFPCCANWETFVADTKCFWTKSVTYFVCNKYCARGQTGKHLSQQQCVRNNVSSFARAFKLITLIEKLSISFYTTWMEADDRTEHKMHLCCEYMQNVNKNLKGATATNQLLLANLTTFLNIVVSEVPRGMRAPWVKVIIKKRPSIYLLFVKCWLSIRFHSSSIKLPRFKQIKKPCRSEQNATLH